jgi:V/A-type H+-transporting ATPase subunit K
LKKGVIFATLGLVLALSFAPAYTCFGAAPEEATHEEEGAAKQEKSGLAVGLAALGAALALGLAALGTGYAQAKIGAAGVGSITEKPELLPTVLIFLVIPETMVILGFVVAILLLTR